MRHMLFAVCFLGIAQADVVVLRGTSLRGDLKSSDATSPRFKVGNEVQTHLIAAVTTGPQVKVPSETRLTFRVQ